MHARGLVPLLHLADRSSKVRLKTRSSKM